MNCFDRKIFFAAALIALAGCHTIVHAPANVQTPVTVYLTDGNVHSSVLFPIGNNRFLEYSRGDWTFAALNKRDIFHAMAALFCSKQTALGQRIICIDANSPSGSEDLHGFVVHPMTVDLNKELELSNSLAERFRNGKTPTLNVDDNVLWVAVEGPYSLIHNCNALTKDNLKRLDCAVDNGSVFAWYRVVPAK